VSFRRTLKLHAQFIEVELIVGGIADRRHYDPAERRGALN
jgi:hypothetical protein